MCAGKLFVERLLHIAPELKGAYNEHLVDYDMLLPHVFMGEVTRFIISQVNKADDLSIVQSILDYFENELRVGEKDSIELILVSFVENLVGESLIVNKLKPMMGPELRKEVESICSY